MAIIAKDPDATLDYTRDWSLWLQTGEVIAASEWSIEGPDDELELGADSYTATFDATTATCWLIGGTVGSQYTVTNHITTDSTPPRIDDRSFSVKVQQR